MRRRLPLAAIAALALTLVLGTIATLSGYSDSYAASDEQLHRGAPSAEVSTFEATDMALSAAVSGCGLCQQTGFCDHAFKGNPGQFCLTLVSGLPCCCPQDAQCVVGNAYNCRCRRVTTYRNQPHSSSTTTRTTTTTTTSAKSMSLFPLIAMLLCVLCCVCAVGNQSREQEEYGRYPQQQQQQQPQYVAVPQYGATEQNEPKYPYAYPSAPPVSPYGAAPRAYAAPYAAPVRNDYGYNNSGGGNALAAGAVGGVAGLATGMLAGSLFGGSSSRPETTTTTTTTTSYFGGDSGYDFAGDTGGGDDGGDFDGDS